MRLRGDLRGRRRDGSEFPVEVRLSAIDSDQGTLILANVVDISERKRAEQELRASEERFELAVKGSSDGIWDWDITTDRVYYSPRFKELIGYADDEMENVFEAWRSKLHEDDLRPTLAAVDAHLKAREPYDVEYRLRTKPGRYRWFRARGQAIWNAAGVATRMAGSITDITDRKHAEEELRTSEARYRTLVEHSPEAIVVLDVDAGRFVDANSNASRLFRLPRSRLLQVHPSDVSPLTQPGGRPSLEASLEKIQQALDGDTAVFDWTHRTSDGVDLPCEVRLVRLPGNGRRLVRASITDITWRKEAERQLRDARDAAETASRAKSEFLANMSHEIRTPMNAVIGMTELVLDTDLTPIQRDYLNTVLESAESLLTIINEVLDFSKIEAGRLELEAVPFDLRGELGDALKPLGLRAATKGLEVACRVGPDVPDALSGDPTRLRQVLVNLVGNAVKFTESGEVLVEVTADERHNDQVALHIAVSDTGVGIPADKLDSIFDAFEQADKSVTRRFGGTGLGLAIASRIAERMGGNIRVESEVGRGSTFHFTARFALADEAAAEPRSLPDLNAIAVLVVDDNATNRRILTEMLGNWGLDVTAVASAAEALAEYHRRIEWDQPLPLLVTDVQMPEMDGYALIERLREQPALRDTTVIVLTSGTRTGDASRSVKLGVAAHLIKPVKQSELLNAILAALEPQLAFPVGLRPDDNLPAIRPLHVLLAEDGRANQKLALALLSGWGHSVVLAQNGEQALAEVESQPFDLVLMDVQMPQMDGLEATRQIRQRERQTGRHVPIIAMTARAMRGDRETCLSAGMDGYVSKPVRKRELYHAIAPFFTDEPDVAGTEESGTLLVPTASGRRPEEGDSRSVNADAVSAARRNDAVSSTVLNWDTALRTVGGDRQLLRDVIDECRSEVPDLLTGIRAAVEQRDAAAVGRLAHTLRGSGRTFGAHDVLDRARQLEQTAEAGDLSRAVEQFTGLQAAAERMLAELESFTP
jgi:PAS domain S-box-containing protein